MELTNHSDYLNCIKTLPTRRWKITLVLPHKAFAKSLNKISTAISNRNLELCTSK